MKKLLFLLMFLSAPAYIHAQACTANFNYQVGQTTPNGTMVFLTDASTSAGTVTGWSWLTSDGQSSNLQNPAFSFNAPGMYQVCLTITAMVQNQLCSSTSCDTIVIGTNNCSALFAWNITSQGVQFIAQQTNATYSWMFGDGTAGTGQSPLHPYSGPGTYTVCLDVVTANGDTCSSCNQVVIPPPNNCTAMFVASSNPGTNAFNFVNLSTGFPNLNYFWTFGDGTTSTLENPTHQYNSIGNFVVCLYISDSSQNCFDSYCDTISVTGNCSAYFTSSVPTGNTVSFNNQSTGNYTNVYWTFGNGSTSTQVNPTVTYANPGTYNVCLTISDSLQQCYDMYCSTVVIQGTAPCVASFYAYTDTSGLMQFVNTSTGNPTNYSWVFSNGTTSTDPNPAINFTTTGWYSACLSIWSVNGTCQSTTCDSVYYNNLCSPVFSWVEDSLNPGTGSVSLNVINPCGGTVTWTFGDGTAATGSSVMHQFGSAGWYWVCVTLEIQGIPQTYCDSVYSNRLSGIPGSPSSDLFIAGPNPASEKIDLLFPGDIASPLEIKLITQTGQLVKSKLLQLSGRQTSLDVSGIASGIYFLSIRTGNNELTRKILIQ